MRVMIHGKWGYCGVVVVRVGMVRVAISLISTTTTTVTTPIITVNITS